MIEILTAIQTLFNGSTALMGIFPNGCYLSLAPYGEQLPVCVLNVISSTPEYLTDRKELNSIMIQFSVFATTDTVALTAISNIKSVFNFCALPMTNDKTVGIYRRNEFITRDQDEKTFHALVQYECVIQEV